MSIFLSEVTNSCSISKKKGAKCTKKVNVSESSSSEEESEYEDDNSEDDDDDCEFTNVQEPKTSQMLKKLYMQLGRAWHRTWYRYRYYTNPSNYCWSIKCHFDSKYLLPIKEKSKNSR